MLAEQQPQLLLLLLLLRHWHAAVALLQVRQG
jgi:hypothetical protein